MPGEPKKRWRELCEEAMKEVDPEKLMKLIERINRLLDQELDARQRPGGSQGREDRD
jgi:hypothetical protein